VIERKEEGEGEDDREEGAGEEAVEVSVSKEIGDKYSM
jgi:hypothetical protein